MTSAGGSPLVANAALGDCWRVRRFPDTRVSVVTALASDDVARRERATGVVIAAYRAPVVAVLERRWELEHADAEDLAHDFFAQALARDWLARYDPAKGRFRTFLRTCLLAFAATAHEAATRQKRGGGLRHVPLDAALAITTDDDVTATFDREWARSVLSLSLAALRTECIVHDRASTWYVFESYDVEGAENGERPTHDVLAQRFGIPATQVTNYLNWARRRFRAHVLSTVRDVTASDEEYREEVRALTGTVAP